MRSIVKLLFLPKGSLQGQFVTKCKFTAANLSRIQNMYYFALSAASRTYTDSKRLSFMYA